MYLCHLWFRICCGLNVSRYKGALSQFSTTAATTFGPIGIDIQLRFAIWPQPLAKLSGGIMLTNILGTLCTKRWHRNWTNKCLHNKASVQRASWMISNIARSCYYFCLEPRWLQRKVPQCIQWRIWKQICRQIKWFTKFSDQFDDEFRKIPNLLIWR